MMMIRKNKDGLIKLSVNKKKAIIMMIVIYHQRKNLKLIL